MSVTLQPAERSARFYALCLTAILLIFLAVNARWIWLYRHGLPLDIDEAGYLSLSVIDYLGLHYGGLRGWIAAIEAPSFQAPLTMALTSLLYYAGGLHVILGFAVTLAMGAGCIVAAYALGRSLDSRWTGLVAASLTATCPVIVNYARSYQFSLPATLVTTLALVAILRARRFRSLGWTLVFGLCLGLMPLARTMTLAFMPGLVAAAFVVVIVDPVDRFRRLLRLIGSGILAVLVAATWLWPNGVLVAQYLFRFGYGARASEFGSQTSKLGIDAWVSMLQAFSGDVYLLHLIVIILGIFVIFIAVTCNLLKHGAWQAGSRTINTPTLPLIIFVTEAIIVLTTSSNRGSGFFAPVTPAFIVLAVWSFSRLGKSACSRRVLSILVTTLVIVTALPELDLHTPFARDWAIDLPIFGIVTVTDGRGTIQRDEARAGYGERNAVEPIDTATGHAWVDLSTWTADTITREIGQHATVAFGFRHELYNINTVNLQQLLRMSSAFGIHQIEPTVTGETVEGYLSWLQHEATDACALLTSDRLGADFPPAINRAFMEEASRRAAFTPTKQWPIPDGQIITMWMPRVTPPNCQ